MTSYLVPESLWWDGRLRTGTALRLPSPSDASLGAGVPVPLADVPADAVRRELRGAVLPGLRDAHVHAALADLATVRAGGIAAVWDLGGVPSSLIELSRYAVTPLPDLRYAGRFLIAPGGYPSDRSWAPAGSWREVLSCADAAAAVHEAHAAGATLIKVTAHAGGPMLPVKTLVAVSDAAHALSLPLVVHAEGPGTVAAALEAGADLLAHTPWTEPLDPGLIRDCATTQQWISTLDIHGWGTPTPAQDTAVANLRVFLAHGGTVLYGTDLGNGPLPVSVNPREIALLLRTGLSADDVLTAMTGPGLTWLPDGLPADPAAFPAALAAAEVLTLS